MGISDDIFYQMQRVLLVTENYCLHKIIGYRETLKFPYHTSHQPVISVGLYKQLVGQTQEQRPDKPAGKQIGFLNSKTKGGPQ